MSQVTGPAEHVFISYVREDSAAVERVQAALEAAGIQVWRDTTNLWPGEDWRARIREVISRNTRLFLACFSRAGGARERSYQREELILAIEELRLRSSELPWLIPVRFDDCPVPDWNIGAGRTLASLQHIDLFGDGLDDQMRLLVQAVVRVLGHAAAGSVPEPERAAVGSGQRCAAGMSGAVVGAQAPVILSPGSSRCTVREADPLELGIHQLAPTAGSLAEYEVLTPYLVRGHDRKLREAIEPAASGGASVLAMVIGKSTVGKTRTAYEALVAAAPDWPMLTPADASELAQMLDEHRIGPGTVVWLNEAQRHLYGTDGEAVAGRIGRLLLRTAGVVVAGTMWTRPYWDELVARGISPDVHAAARALLTGPRSVCVAVPDRFTAAQVAELVTGSGQAAQHRDARLMSAAQGVDGRVIQQLTGGPELVAAYDDGSLLTRPERALVTAALDARRFGHLRSLPSAMLRDAADGYLEPWERPADPQWASKALSALSDGTRDDGSRTDIRQVLRALTAVRSRSGTEADYEPADYLDQHARQARRDEIENSQMWDALTAHTSDPEDLHRLARAARDRGLFRYAVTLWRRAVEGGMWQPYSDQTQIAVRADPGADARLSAWRAPYIARYDREAASVRQPAVSALLSQPLDGMTDGDLISILNRIPLAGWDPLTSSRPEHLLRRLQREGRSEAAAAFARRIAAEADLTAFTGYKAQYLGSYLLRIRETGGEAAINALADRVLAQTNHTSAWYGKWRLESFWRTGAVNAATKLGKLIAEQVDADNYEILDLLKVFQEIGDEGATAVLAERVARSTRVDSWYLAALMELLSSLGAQSAINTLIGRIVEHARQNPSGPILRAVSALTSVAAVDEARSVAAYAASEMDLGETASVSRLLRDLRTAGMNEALQALLDRRLGQHVRLSANASVVADLLRQLRAAGATEALNRVLKRDLVWRVDINSGLPWGIRDLFCELEEAGSAQLVPALAHRIAQDLDARSVTRLVPALEELKKAGDHGAWSTLAERAGNCAEFTEAGAAADLFRLLAAADARQLIAVLGRRAAANVDVDSPRGVTALIAALIETGQRESAIDLANRAAESMDLSDPVIEDTTDVLYEWREELQKLADALQQVGAHEARLSIYRRLVDSGERPDLWEAYASVTYTPEQASALIRFGREPDNTLRTWTWADTSIADRLA